MTARVLDGKVAIVTGAAMGMGEATARVFAAAGAHVLVSDINEGLGEATAERIQQDGGSASFYATDVSKADDAEAMVRAAVERYGRLDCAVNNAAVTPDTHPIADLDEQEFDRILAVDLKGVALCLKYEIAEMLERGDGGAIVNIGSVSSFRPQPNNAAYTAAKHGVIGLMRSWANFLAKHYIRVNSVAPTTVRTPMANMGDISSIIKYVPELANSLTNAIPVEAVDPEDVAAAVAWLASDDARYVTGTVIPVDAGSYNRR
jgi:glucose 1-dehydrogenase